MNITLIAPPAAGKGTQATKISEKYGIPHISTGDLLRNINDDKLKQSLKQGKFVSDELITNLLKERLGKQDCQKGYILDGYPRNLNQAKLYEEILNKQNKKPIVIVLDLDKDVAKQRILGRRICPNCGEVFNAILEDTMPKQEGICDHCQNKLIKRDDDNEETFNKRYQTYEKETQPLIKYYEDKNMAYHVNSGINSKTTTNQIEQIIGGLNDKY